jgi:uncharacterized membrane protein YfcA
MEPLSAEVFVLLFAVATCAGLVDSIAGGGGLLTVPALMWTGLPPTLVLGTNKLQGSFGTLAASIAFWRRGMVRPRALLPAILCTLAGAVAGTLTVQRLDSGFLARLVPALLIAFALYFLLSPRVSDEDAQHRIGAGTFALLVGTSVGFYDGFFGPGTGYFFVIAYVVLLGHNLRRATAHTKVLNFTSNIASLATFALGGHLVWSLGLVMAAGQFVGAWIGSHLVLRHGARLVRPLLVLVSLAVSLRLLLDDSP